MTLEELVSMNDMIGDLSINVYKDDKKVQSYEVGAGAQEDRFPDMTGKPRWVAIKAAINARDAGRDYYEILLKKIPADLRRMQVTSWRNMGHGYRPGMSGNHNYLERLEVFVTTDSWKPEPKEEEKTEGGLEGQLCLW